MCDVIRQIRSALPEGRVLVVDDASPDGTADLVEELAVTLGGVDVLRRPQKEGLASAYVAGFHWGLESGFEAFVEMDADGSHDPAALPHLLSAMKGGADMVIGSRYVPGGSIPRWTLWRRALSLGGNLYAAAALGVPVSDLTSGYRLYSRPLLEAIDLGRIRADGYGFQIEMVRLAHAANARIVETPIRFVDRTQGRSKMSIWIMIEALALVSWWGAHRLLELPRRKHRVAGSADPVDAPGASRPTEGSMPGVLERCNTGPRSSTTP